MKDKTIVITGASSGIGLVTGEYLAAKGYKVYGLSRRAAEDSPINFIACDVTDKAQVAAAFEKIGDDIYAVINNAGIGIGGPVEYASPEDVQRIIDVNIIGIVNVCQAAIPRLRKSKGKIINIGSVAGDLIIPFQTFYSLTKAAAHVLTQGLAMELKPFGIKATTVLPGDTKTSFTANRRTNLAGDEVYKDRIERSIARMEKDEQSGKDPVTVARVIYKVLKRRRPPLKVTVGFEYKLLVFLNRLLPQKLVNGIIYRLYGGEKIVKKLLELFLTFLKIGAFTFGGGYAMIPLIQHEIVEKKKWLTDDEMIDMLTIAESTPGVIAVNSATFVGYKIGGLAGSALATLAVVLPAFLVITLIALFVERFMDISYVVNLFKGLRAGVTVLIFHAALKIFKKTPKTAIAYFLLALAFFMSCFVEFRYLTISLIAFGLIVGLASQMIKHREREGR